MSFTSIFFKKDAIRAKKKKKKKGNEMKTCAILVPSAIEEPILQTIHMQ